MIFAPDSWGSDLTEVWSDAARAAAAAARRAKKSDQDWKKAARAAYLKFSRPSMRRGVALGRRGIAGEGSRGYRRRARRFAPEPTSNRWAGWVGGKLPLFDV